MRWGWLLYENVKLVSWLFLFAHHIERLAALGNKQKYRYMAFMSHMLQYMVLCTTNMLHVWIIAKMRGWKFVTFMRTISSCHVCKDNIRWWGFLIVHAICMFERFANYLNKHSLKQHIGFCVLDMFVCSADANNGNVKLLQLLSLWKYSIRIAACMRVRYYRFRPIC